MDRPDIRKQVEQDRVSRLVVRRDPLLFLRDHTAVLLGSDTDADECLLNVVLFQEGSLLFCRQDRGFIHQVLQIRPGESRCRSCDGLQIHVIRQRFVFRMDLQDLLASLHVRTAHRHLTVKSAGTKDRRIQDVHTVRGSHHDDAFILREAVHLDKQLVQGLFALVVAAAHAGASAAPHRIDLIDKDDAGLVLLGFLKQVPDAAGTYTYEHLHKVRSGDREERNSGFACHRAGNQGLTGSGRADQDHALRDPRADAQELARLRQEFHDLRQFFLLLVQARHIRERDLLRVRGEHLRLALAEVHHGRSAALLAVQEHDQEEDHGTGQQDRDKHGKQGAPSGDILYADGHVIAVQQLDRAGRIGHIDRQDLIFSCRDMQGSGGDLLILDHFNLGDLPLLQHGGQFLLRDVAASVEAVTQRKDKEDAQQAHQYIESCTSC